MAFQGLKKFSQNAEFLLKNVLQLEMLCLGLQCRPDVGQLKSFSMKLINLLPVATAVVIMVAGCASREHNVKMASPVPVSVHVDGFSFFFQDDWPVLTKGDPVGAGNYKSVNAITLAFYQGGVAVYQATQLKDDDQSFETFGDFDLSLPMGSYTLVAVSYTTKEGSPFVLNSPSEAAFTGDHAYETFCYTQTVDITSTAGVEINATLERVVAQLKVVSTDGKAEDVTNVRMSLSAGSKTFNPTTGMATDNTGFVNTVGISAKAGTTSSSVTYLFLATDEQTMDVTIETLDAGGNVLYSNTVLDVPFKRNKITTVTGPMYSGSAKESFLLNTDWITPGETVSF